WEIVSVENFIHGGIGGKSTGREPDNDLNRKDCQPSHPSLEKTGSREQLATGNVCTSLIFTLESSPLDEQYPVGSGGKMLPGVCP
ncbi:unnamed protein product, partial [Allacma fusca]